MTTRRRFIKTLAAIPPAFAFRRSWAASDPSRLALIIGNSNYPDAPLLNPANDARAVTGLFTEAGFTVDSRLNATRVDMMAAIEKFGAAAKRSETKLVVFYYAGHGAQLDWRNYLLPVDAVVERQEHMKQRCVDLGLLLGQLSAAKDKTFVVILDACRNNPFGRSYRPEQKGLSQFDAPVGSLLAYATSPGNVASDGDGQNGLYTENLVRELSRRNTRIEDALKRVRLNVRLASHGEQIPWETTSLEGDVFIFNEGQKKLSEAELEKLLEADVTEWARIKSSKRIDDWVSYLRTFPNGRFAEIAQMRLNRLLADVEKQRLDREQQEAARIEKLAAEKRQQAEQQARDEQKRLSEQKRLDQERIERERHRIVEAERLAEDRKKQEEQRQQSEQKRLAQEKLSLAKSEQVATAKPTPVPAAPSVPPASSATGPAAKPALAPVPSGAPMIIIGAGIPVPMLIAPSDNPYSAGRYPLGRIFTVGDEATTLQTDILTGVEERTRTRRVTRVDYDEDRVEFNGGLIVSDLMGNALKEGATEFHTPRQYTPAEFQVGKKWAAAFSQTQTQKGAVSSTYIDLQIVKRETITVPAGSFDSFMIEGFGWNATLGNRIEMRIWMVPGLNFPVKSEQIRRDRKGSFFRTERQVLVSLRQHTIDTKCAAPVGALQRTLVIRSNCAA